MSESSGTLDGAVIAASDRWWALAQRAFRKPKRYVRLCKFEPPEGKRLRRTFKGIKRWLNRRVDDPFPVLGLTFVFTVIGGFTPFAVNRALRTFFISQPVEHDKASLEIAGDSKLAHANGLVEHDNRGDISHVPLASVVPHAIDESFVGPPYLVKQQNMLERNSAAHKGAPLPPHKETPSPVSSRGGWDDVSPPQVWDGDSAAWAGVIIGFLLTAIAARSTERTNILRTMFERRKALNDVLLTHYSYLKELVTDSIPPHDGTPEDENMGRVVCAPGFQAPNGVAPEVAHSVCLLRFAGGGMGQAQLQPHGALEPGYANYARSMYVYFELDYLEFMYENFRDGFVSDKHFVRSCLVFQSRCGAQQFRTRVEKCLGLGRYPRSEFVKGVRQIWANTANPDNHGFPIELVEDEFGPMPVKEDVATPDPDASKEDHRTVVEATELAKQEGGSQEGDDKAQSGVEDPPKPEGIADQAPTNESGTPTRVDGGQQLPRPNPPE